MKIEVSDEIVQRFHEMVEPEPNTGCWLWAGPSDRLGYGIFSAETFGLGRLRAHRIGFLLFRGPIPNYLYVCHRCDVPACVNPDHLFLGTARDNSRDFHAKRRAGLLLTKIAKPKATPVRQRKPRDPGRPRSAIPTVSLLRVLLTEAELLTSDGQPVYTPRRDDITEKRRR